MPSRVTRRVPLVTQRVCTLLQAPSSFVRDNDVEQKQPLCSSSKVQGRGLSVVRVEKFHCRSYVTPNENHSK